LTKGGKGDREEEKKLGLKYRGRLQRQNHKKVAECETRAPKMYNASVYAGGAEGASNGLHKCEGKHPLVRGRVRKKKQGKDGTVGGWVCDPGHEGSHPFVGFTHIR